MKERIVSREIICCTLLRKARVGTFSGVVLRTRLYQITSGKFPIWCTYVFQIAIDLKPEVLSSASYLGHENTTEVLEHFPEYYFILRMFYELP